MSALDGLAGGIVRRPAMAVLAVLVDGFEKIKVGILLYWCEDHRGMERERLST